MNKFSDNFNLQKAHMDRMFGRDEIEKGGVGSGRHIGDLNKQQKHSLVKKMNIKGHESMTEKELDKHLSDKNVEKQVEEFRKKREEGFKNTHEIENYFQSKGIKVDVHDLDSEGGFLTTYDNVSEKELKNKLKDRLHDLKIQKHKSQETGYYYLVHFKNKSNDPDLQKAYEILDIQKAEIEVPSNHKPAMQVPKGGSSCATCKFVDTENHACKNQYYIEWNGGKSKLPDLPLDEICSDWYEPVASELEKAYNILGIDSIQKSKGPWKKGKEEDNHDHSYLIHVDSERIAREAGIGHEEFKQLHPDTKVQLSKQHLPQSKAQLELDQKRKNTIAKIKGEIPKEGLGK